MNNPAPTRNEASVAGFEQGAPGVTPPSNSAGRHGVFLTDVIIELGFADKERVDRTEDAARMSGKTVEQLLLDDGVIDENQLSLAIAERHGLDHVDLERFDVDMGVAESVARSVAARSGAVPIASAPDGALIVAVQDSYDSLSLRRIETTTGREVRPVIAAVSAIRRLIERLPDEPPTAATEPEVPRLTSQRELQLDGAKGPATEREEKPRPSFDGGLSMDLGPMVMEPESDPLAEEVDLEEIEKAGKRAKGGIKREERVVRELTETKGKVAELERRLEEVVEAAREAISTNEKLRALRRAIDGS